MEAVREGDEFAELIPSDDEGNDDQAKQDALKAVSNGSAKDEDVDLATEWFLSDEDSGRVASKTFELNVGIDETKFIPWTVQAISREEIRMIRRKSQPVARRASGGGQVDEMVANLGIAAAGTLKPDLDDIAGKVGAPDAADVLRARMSHKPGLIDQIAGEVLSVSGYDDEDIRDLDAVRG